MRHDRPELIAFVTDAQSEDAVRTGLADVVSEAIDLRRGGIRAAHHGDAEDGNPAPAADRCQR